VGFHYAVMAGWDGNRLVVVFCGGLEEGHGGFGEIAFVGDLPFVVGFDEHRAGQAQQRSGFGIRRRRRSGA
jgi:hypothetical protein